MNIYIAGTGRFLPEKVLTNHDLEKMVDTSDKWIVERTGIKERHIAEADVAASDLALPAAQQAIEAAGLTPQEIDLIIVGTSTPDMHFPSTACFLQSKLGATSAVAFDQLAACSGFIFSLTTARHYLASGQYKNALVVGAEVYSSIVDWHDRATCVLFGDGAGAVVLRTEEDGQRGICSTHIFSDGSKHDYLSAAGGGSAVRFNQSLITDKLYRLTMNGNRTFKVAIKSMAAAAETALNANSLTPADIKLVIPHQANQRIIDMVAKQVGIDKSLFYSNIERYGNTAAASIPIALDEALRAGKISAGDNILLVAFGGGFTWGSSIIKL